ncbi:hypothetical protein K1718_24840 [Roseibium porphyridii]|uniref:Capsular biosynthesis protein n=1 Tax=Roseibium porphyridii TaxID=2866279 RepID=A0ABY8F9K8_9HYPH|nr:hypothetical protein [Roseibium sp. KMA01]WFE89343.1 hypothetical protein K1718_24840 [Roseibium sp. KMA01]
MLFKIAERAVSLSADLISSEIDRRLAKSLRQGDKVLFFGFTGWKRAFYQSVFSDRDILFVGEEHYNGPKLIEAAFDCVRNQDVHVWSYKDPYWLSALSNTNNCRICRVEDGFLRSVGLGAQRIKPLSIIIERETDLYFHKSRTSTLHKMLRSLTADQKTQFHDKGSELKQLILEQNLSKYNFKDTGARFEVADQSVLVLGQVERDESIRRGPDPYVTCEQLVELAIRENPGATIYFKPHPEVHRGIAEPYSAPFRRFPELREFPQAVNMFAYADAFKRIYTISSLAGFEMLLRGAPVTTLGGPWYAAWGLTDDRNVPGEEVADLTPESLLWAAYGEYPLYLTENGQTTDIFAVVRILTDQLRT